MKKLTIASAVLILLFASVFGLYYSNLNNLKEGYSRMYNLCVQFSENELTYNGLKERYGAQVQECVNNGGCFSDCGNSCTYPDYKDLTFFQILMRYKNPICLAVCESRCFSKP